MIWAWKKNKHGRRLGEYASHIATIFPFEVEYWKEFTEKVSYVGNPLLEEEQLTNSVERHLLSGEKSISIALAPGSRTMELTRILPSMIKTVQKIQRERSETIVFRISCTEYLPKELYRDAEDAGIELFTGSLTELFQNSDIALVTSGTSTLHAALTGIPLLILYKSSPFLYIMVKLLTKHSRFSHIGLPNIMSEKEVAREFIQGDLTADNLCREISKLIDDESYLLERTSRMGKLQGSFGGKVPSEEIIPIIARLISSKR
jgi:lipid-A-disaccharide synthase